MSNRITLYEPLHCIKLFSGKIYYIKSSSLQIIEKALEINKFIKIRDNLINVSSIENIYPASEDLNKVENRLIDFSEQIANDIRREVGNRKEANPYKTMTEGVLTNIIDKYAKNN